MEDFAASRRRMVEEQLLRRGVRDPRVLAAVGRVPREIFVPESIRAFAYDDRPLDIGEGQTISQPYMAALMTEALELRGGERVLEVGTGCGYQTALLLELGVDVLSVERIPELSAWARSNLDAAGYAGRGRLRVGDGTLGSPGDAPFDRILVAAAAPDVPESLVGQLTEGGVLLIPVGGASQQDLLRLRRREDGISRERICACTFVKLIGAEGW